jgi:hypothetical protein
MRRHGTQNDLNATFRRDRYAICIVVRSEIPKSSTPILLHFAPPRHSQWLLNTPALMHFRHNDMRRHGTHNGVNAIIRRDRYAVCTVVANEIPKSYPSLLSHLRLVAMSCHGTHNRLNSTLQYTHYVVVSTS